MVYKHVFDHRERTRNAAIYALHRDLLALRREDSVLGQRPVRVDGAVLADQSWMLRYFDQGGADRLLIVNLGGDLVLDPAPEPLLAPPEGKVWEVLWSSEDPRYGGQGTPPPDTEESWRLPGHAAVALRPAAPG